MAKFESSGFCPDQWLDFGKNESLEGLWRLIGTNVFYENLTYQTSEVNKVFTSDAIAQNLLEAIIRKNVNAEKICVKFGNTLKEVISVIRRNPSSEIVATAASNFLAVVCESPEAGLDVWLWVLTHTTVG